MRRESGVNPARIRRGQTRQGRGKLQAQYQEDLSRSDVGALARQVKRRARMVEQLGAGPGVRRPPVKPVSCQGPVTESVRAVRRRIRWYACGRENTNRQPCSRKRHAAPANASLNCRCGR